jgi:N-methylhydantoinase B
MSGANQIDPIDLSVFLHAMHSIAEEMGAALRRTAISPNIKERRDYSCAVFDGQARVLAMGDHMPVHLGSMPMSVEAAVRALDLRPGDLAILNDPYAGGTHLPDITMVLPVFLPDTGSAPSFFVAARAHHSDVGGMYPGSMGPAREIYQEGIRIPPIRLIREGILDCDILSLLLANVRTPAERDGDLQAQIGACRVGETRLLQMAELYGATRLDALGNALLDYSERLIRSQLRALPAGEFSAEDFLDGAGSGSDQAGGKDEPIRIAVRLRIDPAQSALEIDFAGSSSQVQGSLNAVRAITLSACFYLLRCLLPEDAPSTAGLLRPLTVLTTPGTIVDAVPPAAVAGGNVETSQRIVDTLLRALAQALPGRVPAASAGTMSNLTIGGIDPRTREPFTYYETTAGGMGARPTADGLSGVQTHMTNSLNTPIEALEFAYPLRLRRYGYRKGSGGAGQFRGGDGLVREVELLTNCEVTLLADRRRSAPYGLAGGEAGEPGHASMTTPENDTAPLPGKCSLHAGAGSVLHIETPGGGGWGNSRN